MGGYTKELPSNGEISDELYRLSAFHWQDELHQQLLNMRLLAIDIMVSLERFLPRLIGSVSTGRIRLGSDIDLRFY